MSLELLMRPLGMVLENEMNVDLTLKVIKINIGIYFLWGNKKKISKSRKFLPNFSKFPFFSFFSVLIQKEKERSGDLWIWLKMIARLSSYLFSRRVTCFLIPKFRSGIMRCGSLKKCLNGVSGIAQMCVRGHVRTKLMVIDTLNRVKNDF